MHSWLAPCNQRLLQIELQALSQLTKSSIAVHEANLAVVTMGSEFAKDERAPLTLRCAYLLLVVLCARSDCGRSCGVR